MVSLPDEIHQAEMCNYSPVMKKKESKKKNSTTFHVILKSKKQAKIVIADFSFPGS